MAEEPEQPTTQPTTQPSSPTGAGLDPDDLRLPLWTSTSVLFGLLFVGLFVYLWPNIFIAVHPGEGAVLWRRFGGGTNLEESYGEGTLVTLPWNRVYVYDLTVQQIRVDLPAYTSDGMEVHARLSARFRVDRDNLPRLHTEVGPLYVEKIIEPELITSTRMLIGKYASTELYTLGDATLLEDIRADIEARLEHQDIDFDEVLFIELTIPEQVQDAIQRKLAIEQEALAVEHVLNRERGEKQRRIIEAQGIAAFEDISGLSILRWRALDVATEFARSPANKVILLGSDPKSLPVVLGADLLEASETSEQPSPEPATDGTIPADG